MSTLGLNASIFFSSGLNLSVSHLFKHLTNSIMETKAFLNMFIFDIFEFRVTSLALKFQFFWGINIQFI